MKTVMFGKSGRKYTTLSREMLLKFTVKHSSLSKIEWRLVLLVFDYMNEDELFTLPPRREIAVLFGVSPSYISKGLKGLIDRGIIIKHDPLGYSFNPKCVEVVS
jgi:DNA-binding MarR family transcriptional regulator